MKTNEETLYCVRCDVPTVTVEWTEGLQVKCPSCKVSGAGVDQIQAELAFMTTLWLDMFPEDKDQMAKVEQWPAIQTSP